MGVSKIVEATSQLSQDGANESAPKVELIQSIRLCRYESGVDQKDSMAFEGSCNT